MQTYPASSDSMFLKPPGSDSSHFSTYLPFSTSFDTFMGNGDMDSHMYPSDNPSDLLNDTLDLDLLGALPPTPSSLKMEARPMSAPSAKTGGYHVGSNGTPIGFMPYAVSPASLQQQHPPPSLHSQHVPLQPQSASRSQLTSSGSTLPRLDSTVAPSTHLYQSALPPSASQPAPPPPPAHHPTSPHREGLDPLRDVRDGNLQRMAAHLLHKPRGSNGNWVAVPEHGKLRVTKGSGKRMLIEVADVANIASAVDHVVATGRSPDRVSDPGSSLEFVLSGGGGESSSSGDGDDDVPPPNAMRGGSMILKDNDANVSTGLANILVFLLDLDDPGTQPFFSKDELTIESIRSVGDRDSKDRRIRIDLKLFKVLKRAQFCVRMTTAKKETILATTVEFSTHSSGSPGAKTAESDGIATGALDADPLSKPAAKRKKKDAAPSALGFLTSSDHLLGGQPQQQHQLPPPQQQQQSLLPSMTPLHGPASGPPASAYPDHHHQQQPPAPGYGMAPYPPHAQAGPAPMPYHPYSAYMPHHQQQPMPPQLQPPMGYPPYAQQPQQQPLSGFNSAGSTSPVTPPSQQSTPPSVSSQQSTPPTPLREESPRASAQFEIPGDTVVKGSLHVEREIRATTFSQLSDMRLKTNVTDLADALDIVRKLQGKSFEWKRVPAVKEGDGDAAESQVGDIEMDADTQKDVGAKPGGTRVIGFIAQEVQKVLPQVVQLNEDGFLSVSYSEILPVLLEAFKELLRDYQSDRILTEASLMMHKETVQELQSQLASTISRVQRLSLDLKTPPLAGLLPPPPPPPDSALPAGPVTSAAAADLDAATPADAALPAGVDPKPQDVVLARPKLLAPGTFSSPRYIAPVPLSELPKYSLLPKPSSEPAVVRTATPPVKNFEMPALDQLPVDKLERRVDNLKCNLQQVIFSVFSLLFCVAIVVGIFLIIDERNVEAQREAALAQSQTEGRAQWEREGAAKVPAPQPEPMELLAGQILLVVGSVGLVFSVVGICWRFIRNRFSGTSKPENPEAFIGLPNDDTVENGTELIAS